MMGGKYLPWVVGIFTDSERASEDRLLVVNCWMAVKEVALLLGPRVLLPSWGGGDPPTPSFYAKVNLFGSWPMDPPPSPGKWRERLPPPAHNFRSSGVTAIS